MILHLIETGGPGGAEQMLLRLADEYARRGIRQMVCLRKDGWLAEEVRRRNLELIIEPLGGLPDLAWLRKLHRCSIDSGVSAIHAHEFAMNVRGAMLGKWLGVLVVATVHGKGYYGDKWSRKEAYKLVSRLANLVAVSGDIREHLVRHCGLDARRVKVIPNGIDVDRFRFDPDKRKVFRKHLGVPDSTLLLGSVGSYYPVKGHSYLINAMKNIVAINSNVKLVLAGQGPLQDDLRNLAVASGLEDYVHVVGYIDDTVGLLSALDIFVMPSLSEGLPLALLEAAANGRPIVASRVGGIPEIINHQVNGVLVSPTDVNALADALVELCDPVKCLHLGTNVYKTVKKNWSIQKTADCYLELLLPKSIKDEHALRGV